MDGCKKTDTPEPSPVVDRDPVATPIGQPVGAPVSKNIGSGGGTLRAADGRMEIVIPAGALSANTDISIQPVENESPGGLGLAYHLMPDGIRFAQPATIIYHYTDQEINGSHPFFLFIAFQDSSRMWRADTYNRELDTVSRTVQLEISHFSIWSLMDNVRMHVAKDEMSENEINEIHISETFPQSKQFENNQTDDDPPLPNQVVLPGSVVTNWKVDGQANTLNGQLTTNGASAVYKSPELINEERTIQISAELKYHLIVYSKRKKIAEFNKFIVAADIKLIPFAGKFSIHIDYKHNYDPSVYTDQADFNVEVKGSKITVSEITNAEPVINPGTVNVGGCTLIWAPGLTGLLNVTSVIGSVDFDGIRKAASLIINETDEQSPAYSWTCPDQPAQFVDYIDIGRNQGGVRFIVKDSVQIYTSGDGQTEYKYTVTPKN